MKKAIFDSDGFPVAFYADDINPVIPPGTVDITDEQWQDFLMHQPLRKWENGQVVVVAPSAPPLIVPDVISSRQFWTQMANANFIDESEAVKAMGGDIPNSIKQFINTLPVLQRFTARMFFEAPVFERHKRVATDMQACFSLTSAAVDQFFLNAAAL
jgi:hypothetical protein